MVEVVGAAVVFVKTGLLGGTTNISNNSIASKERSSLLGQQPSCLILMALAIL